MSETFVPRILRDDGMIAFSEVAHYTHLKLTQYVPVLRWTPEKPTQPGWYWYRSKSMSPSEGTCHITEAEDGLGGSDLYFNDAVSLDNCMEFEWAGPIPPPEEP